MNKFDKYLLYNCLNQLVELLFSRRENLGQINKMLLHFLNYGNSSKFLFNNYSLQVYFSEIHLQINLRIIRRCISKLSFDKKKRFFCALTYITEKIQNILEFSEYISLHKGVRNFLKLISI